MACEMDLLYEPLTQAMKMIIQQITHYLQGKLSEEEALELWLDLLKNPDDWALLETYLLYRAWYSRKARDHQGTDISSQTDSAEFR